MDREEILRRCAPQDDNVFWGADGLVGRCGHRPLRGADGIGRAVYERIIGGDMGALLDGSAPGIGGLPGIPGGSPGSGAPLLVPPLRR